MARPPQPTTATCNRTSHNTSSSSRTAEAWARAQALRPAGEQRGAMPERKGAGLGLWHKRSSHGMGAGNWPTGE
eukprot:356913-Chlamydomonas_euryale.AAC.7